MSLASIDLEKSFTTIGCRGSFFILLNLNYNAEDIRHQNIDSYKNKIIHKYVSLKYGNAMLGIVLVLRPRRYSDVFDLVSSINHDFGILGVKELIYFEQIHINNIFFMSIKSRKKLLWR